MTLVTTRAIVLALTLAFLLPGVEATVVLVPVALSADLERDEDGDRRIYVAVAGGNIDPTLGDMIVLTTADCDIVGCPRDLWFRFLDGPADVPTVGDAARFGQHMAGRVTGDCAANPVTAAARVQAGCWQPRETVPGFHDIPLATTAADETLAFTDGRFVVYASGPVNGPYDVYRFDARNPDAPVVLVAGTAADERPFGVFQDRVGVSVANGDGTVTLRMLDLDVGVGEFPDLWLASTPSTVSAVLGSAGATWAVNQEMWFRPYGDAATYAFHDPGFSYSDLAVHRDTLAFVRSSDCTPPAADCNTHVAPPKRSQIFTKTTRTVVVDNKRIGEPVETAIAAAGAISTAHARPHSPVVWSTLVAWKVLDQTAAPTETLKMNDAPAGSTAPCAWSQPGLPPETLGDPVFLRTYLVQLDFRASGPDTCRVNNPGSNVAAYAMVCAKGSPPQAPPVRC